jgi:AcrR family transcriptional regulator
MDAGRAPSAKPAAPEGGPEPAGARDALARRRRDAVETRRLLLQAARDRFAVQGYAATTVREIADDAGVNASLISRYFESKEGLFEECLNGVSTELGSSAPTTTSSTSTQANTPNNRAALTLDEVAVRMAEQLTGPYSDEHPNQLVLLLRTSGDERAERIRFDKLRTYAEGLADVAGAAAGRAEGPVREELVLRAQLTLSAALGIALLRSRTALEPLASAETADLLGPLTAMIRALLSAEGGTGDR